MELYEDFVLEQVRAGAPITGLYPATDTRNLDRFEEWKARNRIGEQPPGDGK
jgi:hypothetical protein